MTFYIYNLGCKVNSYDASKISAFLSSLGLIQTKDFKKADYIIVNSCTVTSKSDSKSRKMLGHFKKVNPRAKIILSGCMPQVLSDEEIEVLPCDFVIGNNNLFDLSKIINNENKKKNIVKKHQKKEEFSTADLDIKSEKTRAKLKIQDGCNSFCSYCIIPYARGRERSMQLDKVFEKIDKIDELQYKELVLVGINLSRYYSDHCKSLLEVIEYADKKENIERIRLGSLEYDNITDEFLENLSKTEKFCPQFHLSVQSGSDKILKNMNRHYTTEEYKSKINTIRNLFDDATITTDIIIGFPGEEKEDFEKTLDFVKDIKFEKVHVFPYSIRRGTKAALMKQVDPQIKKQRVKKLISVSEKIREAFLENQIGKTLSVLTEQKIDGYMFGYTKNYIPVKILDEKMENNQIVNVKITDVKDMLCVCE